MNHHKDTKAQRKNTKGKAGLSSLHALCAFVVAENPMNHRQDTKTQGGKDSKRAGLSSPSVLRVFVPLWLLKKP